MYPHSSYCLPCSLGDSHNSQIVGLRLLTKIENKGKGLGIHEKSMVELVKVKVKPLFERLENGEGEFSHAMDANNCLKEEPSQEKSKEGNKTSSSRNGDTCKMSKRRENTYYSRNACTKGAHEWYKKPSTLNVSFDFKKVGNVKSLWFRKTCIFCGLNNHSVAKSWKMMALYRKIKSTSKETMHQDSSPKKKKEKGKKDWILKMLYAYCKQGRHQGSHCWKLHLELRPKKETKKIVVDSLLVNTGQMKRLIYVRKNSSLMSVKVGKQGDSKHENDVVSCMPNHHVP